MSGEDIEAEIEAIAAMDLDQLRKQWSRRYGAPPRLRSEPISAGMPQNCAVLRANFSYVRDRSD